MTADEVLAAIEAGRRIVEELRDTGCDLLGVGEMGIGNTTASSAIVAVSHGAFLHAVAAQLSDGEPGVLEAGHVLRLEPLGGAATVRRR